MKKSLHILLLSILVGSLSTIAIANPAVQAFEEENYQLAKELFEKNKETAISKLYLGRLAMRDGDLDEAEDLMKEALKMKPNDADYHYWFASLSGMQAGNASIFSAPGYASDSKEHFIKAVELDPNSVKALSGLISFYSQAPSIVGGSTEKAQKLTVKLLELDKKEGLLMQINLHRKEGNVEQELASAEQLANLYPNSSGALLNAAFSFQSKKKYEKAYVLFNQATKAKFEGADTSDALKQQKAEKRALISAIYQVGRNAVLSHLHIEEGIQALESYMNLELSKAHPSKNWAKVRLAALYLESGNKKKAKELALIAKMDKSDGGPRKTAKKLLKKLKS